MTLRVASLGPREIDHELLWSAVGAAAFALGWLAVSRAWPLVPSGCLFKAITGWPCLTCGATRAILALTGAHLVDALRWNPLVTLLVVGWGAYIPYGAGASAGLWPRVRVVTDARERAALRHVAVLSVALTWVFLVYTGR